MSAIVTQNKLVYHTPHSRWGLDNLLVETRPMSLSLSVPPTCVLTLSQANTLGWVGEPIINLTTRYQFLSPAHTCKYLTRIRHWKPKKLKRSWTKDFCFSVVFVAVLSVRQRYQIEKTWENHLAQSLRGFQTLTTRHRLGKKTLCS